MARTIAIWGPTGLATPTSKLMLRSTATTVAETITLTEHATVKRLYTGTVTASAGDYYHNLLSAGSYVGGGTITVSGTDGTTSYEDFAASPAGVNTEVLDVIGTDALIAGVTIKEAIRRIGALTSGIVTGAGTGSETFKDYAESASTIVITADIFGNRSEITYN